MDEETAKASQKSDLPSFRDNLDEITHARAKLKTQQGDRINRNKRAILDVNQTAATLSRPKVETYGGCGGDKSSGLFSNIDSFLNQQAHSRKAIARFSRRLNSTAFLTTA
jgi:hypothetical protein